MKIIYSVSLNCIALLIPFFIFSQGTTKTSMQYGGIKRTYSYYVPAKYSKGNPVPLVFNLHGYGSNGDQQEFYGDFRKIADTAGFIVVHPTGTLDPQSQQTFWNCGLVAGNTVDDVGFIHALIDTLSLTYSINPDRIYSTGMSNGGFMSYHLACTSNRFAAIASVTGSMTAFTLAQCKNAKAIPVMEIHGDADPTVNYNGSAGILSIPKVLEYWVDKNSLDPLKLIQTLVPDINTADGATAQLFIYPGTNEVQHYKILNGGHTWPGAIIAIGTTCMDFSASKVIWDFFSKYSLKTSTTLLKKGTDIKAFPNPVIDDCTIILDEDFEFPATVDLYSMDGKNIVHTNIFSNKQKIDFSNFKAGVYIINIKNKQVSYSKLICKN